MPIHLVGSSLLLPRAQVERLWKETIKQRQYPDEVVNIRVVSPAQITRLNQRYRRRPGPTNVLTFSYPGEHDIAICRLVIKQEAAHLGMPLAAYAAWVFVHAFVHVTGLDHEQSPAQARRARQAEASILRAAGYRQ